MAEGLASRDDRLNAGSRALRDHCRRLCAAARDERAMAAGVVAESRRIRALARAAEVATRWPRRWSIP
jgi:hypothetical protein